MQKKNEKHIDELSHYSLIQLRFFDLLRLEEELFFLNQHVDEMLYDLRYAPIATQINAFSSFFHLTIWADIDIFSRGDMIYLF